MYIRLTGIEFLHMSQRSAVSTVRQTPGLLGAATLTVAPGVGEFPQETMCAVASHLGESDLHTLSLTSPTFIAGSSAR